MNCPVCGKEGEPQYARYCRECEIVVIDAKY